MHKFTFYDFLKINRKRTNRPLMWSVVCLLLTMHFGFAKPNAEMGILGDPCSQITENNVPGGQSGLGFGSDPNKAQLAFDILVDQGCTFEIQTIKIHRLVDTGTTSTNINVIIREDNSGLPGDVLYTFNNVTIANSEIFGSNFSWESHETTLDISVHNLVLNTPATSSKTYWMEISGDFSGLITTNSYTKIGKPMATKSFNGSWQHHSNSADAVYELIGECTGCWMPKDLSVTINSFTDIVLNWSNTGVSYDVEWGEAGFSLGTGTQINGITTNSTTVTTVADTEYQFYVRQSCDGNNLSGWAGPYDFKATYCVPVFTNPSGHISTFSTSGVGTTSNINHISDVWTQQIIGYLDLSEDATQVVTQKAGLSVDFSCTNNSGSTTVRIWIDWNKNGVFEDDEVMYSQYAGTDIQTGSFSIPDDALGDYRMRVRLSWWTDLVGPCVTSDWGQVVDFKLVVLDPPSCITPNSLTATQNSFTNFTLGWTSSGSLFDVEWGMVGFSQGTGTLINSITTDFVDIDGITDTDYQFYVRQDCGNGEFSFWVGPFDFRTGLCKPVYTSDAEWTTAFTTSGIGTTSNANYTATSQQGINGYLDLTGDTSQTITQSAGLSVDFSHMHSGEYSTIMV